MFKCLKLNGFLLLFLLLLQGCKDIATEPKPTPSQRFQSILENHLEAFNAKGVSAAILFQNLDIWSGSSGVSHGSSAITGDYIFNIGSVTKTFISALCLQLASEGKFTLDDSLHAWLPDYPNIDHSITIRQLLYNTSGVYNISDNVNLWNAVFTNPTKRWTPEDVITAYLNEPYSTPGAGYFYSNTNYILLGLIINEATGSDISAELRDRFFEPLGLNHTFFAVEESLPTNIAHAWFDLSGNGSYDDMSFISRTGIYSVLWTSAAIFSNAEDLAIWSSALFAGHVLDQSSLDQMMNPCCCMPGTTDVGCGMGIFLIGPRNNTGTSLIGYTGRTFGYLTSMFYLPDYGISVAVLLNEDNTVCLDLITTDLVIEILDNI